MLSNSQRVRRHKLAAHWVRLVDLQTPSTTRVRAVVTTPTLATRPFLSKVGHRLYLDICGPSDDCQSIKLRTQQTAGLDIDSESDNSKSILCRPMLFCQQCTRALINLAVFPLYRFFLDQIHHHICTSTFRT